MIFNLFDKARSRTACAYFVSYFCLFPVHISPNFGSLLAQELTLFEEVESNETENRRNRERSVVDGDDGPTFTLIGTTRVGSSYSAFLKDRKGATIVVSSNSVRTDFIPGYSSYELVETRAGSVLVRYPDGEPCVEYLERGIRCGEAHLAILTLTNADPMRSVSGTRSGSENFQSSDGEPNGNQEEQPINPFAALLEQSANPDAGDNNRFVPRRIRAEDVPSGMRVVSTPFGDRLVEEQD